MALRNFSIVEDVGLLTTFGSNDEEVLSEDEMIGNFMTEGGGSVVLSSEMLSRVPAMTVAPFALEMDSLLLGKEDDDVAEEGGDCGEGSAAIGHGGLLRLCSIGLRHQPTALSLNFQSLGNQLVHLLKLSLPKHILECFQLFLSLHCSAYL